MCDPVTLAVSATALAAVGTGVSTVAAVNQAKYEGKIADANAKTAAAQAADANDRGKLDLQRVMRRQAQLQGQQRLALAANGVETDFGTAADVQRDTASLASEDYATTLKNTEREAAGYDISATNYRAQAKSSRSAADAALVSGAFNFGSTVLGGVGNVGRIKARQSAGYSGW